MSVQIQTPNITAATDREKLQQMQSYLYRMAQQLQWAFDTIGTGGGGGGTGSYMAQTGNKGSGSNSNASALETFSQLKSLIIKSADIVEAYYDAIKVKLEGSFVAKSDFGEYVEKTDLALEANSTAITQNYTNIQGILGDFSELLGEMQEDVDTLTAFIVETNAYIKSGKIDEVDGVPVYGLEIGQSNSVNGEIVFSKFARFSADRLSFYDRNDVEVAYISDYKLYITNAEITGNLWLSGRFKIYYKGGLAFQWIGGDS